MSRRLVIGDGSCRPADIAFLAIRVIDHARALGLRTQVHVTRSPTGFSRYLTIRDHAGRDWLVRLSNHFRPRFRGQRVPHFDLVSQDGVSGEAEAKDFVAAIAAHTTTWVEAPIERNRPRRRP